MDTSKKPLSKPAQKRLIKLTRVLSQLQKTDKKIISSSEIQQRTGWNSLTIRKDISLLGINCSQPTGYEVAALKEAICKILDLDTSEKTCCIVGLGRLGSALIGFTGFADSTFKIAAGFDSSINRTEVLRSPFPLYPTSRMEAVIAKEKIEYAILAVPEHTAQVMALRLSQCGIKGIVNYTSIILRVPETTAVENLSIIDALQNLAARTAAPNEALVRASNITSSMENDL